MLRLDELPHIPLFNMNPAGYAGFFCVFPGKLHAVRVNVPTVCLKVRIPADRIDGSAPFLSPDLLGNPAPFGCGKLPVDAGGNVQRLDGALDQEGAAAAEGITQHGIAPDPGKIQDPCRQGLLDGGKVGVLPIAPLVQACAGGIQIHAHMVVL